jgi:hypothetical protein
MTLSCALNLKFDFANTSEGFAILGPCGILFAMLFDEFGSQNL